MQTVYAYFKSAVKFGKQQKQEQIRNKYNIVTVLTVNRFTVMVVPYAHKSQCHGKYYHNLNNCHYRLAKFYHILHKIPQNTVLFSTTVIIFMFKQYLYYIYSFIFCQLRHALISYLRRLIYAFAYNL